MYFHTQAQSSPYNSGADDAAELADLFSPLPSTGGTSGGGGKGGSSNKKARVSGAVDRYVPPVCIVRFVPASTARADKKTCRAQGSASLCIMSFRIFLILMRAYIISNRTHTVHIMHVTHPLCTLHTHSASLPRAVWDLDDDGPDLLEQRSLALMKSTGELSFFSCVYDGVPVY